MIRLVDSAAGITPEMLQGFFVGWPNPPSPETHLRLLQSSCRVVLAVDDEAERVIGFVSAISDGVLSAHITLLEVLPEYQGNGIGQAMMRLMIDLLGDLYAVDLVCDPEMVSYYSRLGMRPTSAMMIRNYDLQVGRNQ